MIPGGGTARVLRSRTMRTRRALRALAVAGLLSTFACGGDDDTTDDAEAPVTLDVDETAEDLAGDVFEETADATSDDTPEGGDAGDASDDDTSDGDDVSGEGSNDETQENLDEAGVDLDLDELEDTAAALSTGEGGGVVTIDGVDWTFEAEVCIAQGGSLVVTGPGSSSDGTLGFVDVSVETEEDIDSDGEVDESVTVSVEVGKTEMFGSGPDDQPDWYAAVTAFGGVETREFEYQLSDGRITGEGTIQDFNGVAIPFGESVPFSFEAGCT